MTAADNRLFVEAVLYRYRAGTSAFGGRKRLVKKNRMHRAIMGRSKYENPRDLRRRAIDAPLVQAQWRTGNLTGFYLTPGQACDLDGADVLLDGVEADMLIADRG